MIADLQIPAPVNRQDGSRRLLRAWLRLWRKLANMLLQALPFGLLGVLIAVGITRDTGQYGPEISALLLIIIFAGSRLSQKALAVLIVASELGLLAIYGVLRRANPTSMDASQLVNETFLYALMVAGAGLIVYFGQRRAEKVRSDARTQQSALAERSRWLDIEIHERHRAEISSFERHTELSSLLETSNAANATAELGPLLKSVAGHIAKVLPYCAIEISEITESGAISTLYADGVPGFSTQALSKQLPYSPDLDLHLAALRSLRVPVVIEALHGQTAHAWGLRQRLASTLGTLPALGDAAFIAPLIIRDRVDGYILLTAASAQAFTESKTTVLSAFANLIGDAIEKSQLQLQAMQSAALSERHRLARELHDLVSQSLFGIVLGIRTIEHCVELGKPAPPEAVKYVHDLAESALTETRALVFELRPDYLSKEGLLSALKKQSEALCEHGKIDLKIHFALDEPAVSIPTKEAIYGIVIEAIKNVIRHAGAKNIELSMLQDRSSLLVYVQDDGVGADLARLDNTHRGLRSMRDRAAANGCALTFSHAPDLGTRVSIIVPCA